jgi:hypothetical protein
MRDSMMRRLTPVAIVGVCTALLLGGCTAGMGRYNTTVAPSEGLRDASGTMPSIEVDLVGVNESELARWRTYPVGDYFSGRDQFRADADRYTMAFTDSNPGPQTLDRSNPIWQKWKDKQAVELFVLVNLPGVSGERAEDPRRLMLPLSSDRWAGDEITIEVQRSGVVCRTPMKPAK